MNRLEHIFNSDPEWGADIVEFVNENPEFKTYLKYVALNRYSEIPKSLVTIKDMLKYYVSFAGVNANYGCKVFEWVKNLEYNHLTDKKRVIMEAIDQLPEISTREEFNKIVISGVGEGAKSFICQHYFRDTDIIYPSDRIFQKGLSQIYGINKVSVSEAKSRAQKWQGKRSVGSMFCFQVGNYGHIKI